MSATPMLLEDALRFSGYAIEAYEHAGVTITTPEGKIVVPPMILSRLSWEQTFPASLGSAFYLDRLPTFHPSYAPVQLSIILDTFRRRRLGYNTPDEFGLAVRRWGAMNLGGASPLIRRYLSAAVDLPLTDIDITRTGDESGSSQSDGTGSATDTATTSDASTAKTKARDAESQYPQGQLSGNLDYASGSVDRVGDSDITGSGSSEGSRTAEDHRTTTDTRTDKRTEKGRYGRSVMELLQQQRDTFMNVDQELVTQMESLFLGVFDRSEADPSSPSRWGW